MYTTPAASRTSSAVSRSAVNSAQVVCRSTSEPDGHFEKCEPASPASAEIPLLIARWDYRPQSYDEIGFNAGDILELIQSLDDSWALLRNANSETTGVGPTLYLRKLKGLCESWECDYAEGMILAAKWKYTAASDDEIDLRIGDTVQFIRHLDDNWAEVKNITTKMIGTAPSTYLVNQDHFFPGELHLLQSQVGKLQIETIQREFSFSAGDERRYMNKR
jgi:Variant SH3 domain/SH3 domain